MIVRRGDRDGLSAARAEHRRHYAEDHRSHRDEQDVVEPTDPHFVAVNSIASRRTFPSGQKLMGWTHPPL
jgi:hypothetical protein